MSNICTHPGEMTVVCTGVAIRTLPTVWLICMRADVVSTVVLFAISVGMLVVVEIITFVVEFIFKLTHAVQVLADAIIGSATGVGTEVNVNSLAAVMTALEFASASPLEELLLCC